MVNQAMVIGRLGKDPEVKYLQNGNMVVNFSVATDESHKKEGGEKVEKTEWHNVVAYGKLAEICGNYLSKGKLIYISGKLQTSNWEKAGVKHYKTEINAREMKMLEKREDRNEPEAPPF